MFSRCRGAMFLPLPLPLSLSLPLPLRLHLASSFHPYRFLRNQSASIKQSIWPMVETKDQIKPTYPEHFSTAASSLFSAAPGGKCRWSLHHTLHSENDINLIDIDTTVREILFIGRSNVGKSTVINKLVNAPPSRPLAITSSTPGRTQHIFQYSLQPNVKCQVKNTNNPSSITLNSPTSRLILTDAPGLGYGRSNVHTVRAWNKLIGEYIRTRPSLHIMLLVDSRRGLMEIDMEFMLFLDELRHVTYQLVLTKCDRLSPQELTTCINNVRHYFTHDHPSVKYGREIQEMMQQQEKQTLLKRQVTMARKQMEQAAREKGEVVEDLPDPLPTSSPTSASPPPPCRVHPWIHTISALTVMGNGVQTLRTACIRAWMTQGKY